MKANTYTIRNSYHTGLKIEIPYRRNYPVAATMLILWIIVLIWHFDSIWLILGIPILFGILNMCFGKEIIFIEGIYLFHYKCLFKIKTSNKYYIKNIKNIIINEIANATPKRLYDLEVNFWGTDYGKISFDYGKDNVRIGGDLDEAEAKDVMDAISKFINGNRVTEK
jgi:hypothetical protein